MNCIGIVYELTIYIQFMYISHTVDWIRNPNLLFELYMNSIKIVYEMYMSCI